MDTLKLFVIDESFDLPFAVRDAWAATPEEPDRVRELRGFLASLPPSGWDSEVFYVQFIR